MVVLEEGGILFGRISVRVLVNLRFLIIGIECFDDDFFGIVNFLKLWDVELENEDYICLVIDLFLDG